MTTMVLFKDITSKLKGYLSNSVGISLLIYNIMDYTICKC